MFSGPASHQGGLRENYEQLILLNPLNPRPMRALAQPHAASPATVAITELELERARTAARVQNVWGGGAYNLGYVDASAR